MRRGFIASHLFWREGEGRDGERRERGGEMEREIERGEGGRMKGYGGPDYFFILFHSCAGRIIV
jgi:hypothetical protein